MIEDLFGGGGVWLSCSVPFPNKGAYAERPTLYQDHE